MKKIFKSNAKLKKTFLHQVGLFTLHVLSVIGLIGFMQCKPDSLDNAGIVNEKKISSRTCDPGDYSINDGRMVFDDTTEYHKTLAFLECASEASIIDWADNIAIETTGKAFRTFWEAICDNGMTEAQYNTLKSAYVHKVKMSTNGSGDDEFERLFPVLNEVANLDGEFQVAGTILKLQRINLLALLIQKQRIPVRLIMRQNLIQQKVFL